MSRMMKMKRIFLTCFAGLIFLASNAQDGTQTLPTFKVGVFAPLYLDSVFSGTDYRYGKKFPRFSLQGLDFVQGVQIALDSMPLPNGNIAASIYDSKSATGVVASLISSHALDSLQLIIGSVKDEEYGQLARFALQKNIPFISATYPNDGGITENPYLVIVNSTLKAHCEAIFSYMLQNHGSDNILHFRKPGSQEDRVAGYFNNINKPDGKALLNIKTISIDSNFNILKSKLDSTRPNIIIGGSLDETFAYNLTIAASALKKKYDITLIGMPNWDGFSSLTNAKKESLNDFPIYFTSPYFNYRWDNYSKMIQDVYLKKYKGKPSDYAYKGFETIYIFARLLTRYRDDLMNHLNDYPYKVFSEYNFKPVFLSKTSAKPDYYENKHLYFLKRVNGVVTKAW